MRANTWSRLWSEYSSNCSLVHVYGSGGVHHLYFFGGSVLHLLSGTIYLIIAGSAWIVAPLWQGSNGRDIKPFIPTSSSCILHPFGLRLYCNWLHLNLFSPVLLRRLPVLLKPLLFSIRFTSNMKPSKKSQGHADTEQPG